jgi:hypothetical protein
MLRRSISQRPPQRRAPRLVTAAQRSYSFDLLLYGTKFARAIPNALARSMYALREMPYQAVSQD